MAIKKILKLKGVGRFEDFKATGDIEFRKYTLIYADNGTGKTTLCDVIRSLQTGVPDYILGRRTLGYASDPQVQILLSDGTVASFQGEKWSRSLDNVTIFDANYVSQNVHAGEIVESDQRRNLFRVIVGEEGVRLARQVEDLESAKSALNTPIRVAKQAVEASLAGSSLSDFLKIKETPEIDDKLRTAERLYAAAEKADQIRRHRGFEELPEPQSLTPLRQVLAGTLDGVSQEAEQRLRSHVLMLGRTDAERWLAKGLGLLHDDTCPFCDQNVQGLDLISAYRACFSAAYSDLADQVKQIRADVTRDFGELATSKIGAVVARNAEAARFWAEYLANPVTVTGLDQGALEEAAVQVHSIALQLLERKAATLLEPIAEEALLQQAENNLLKITTAISTYNAAVKVANARIEGQKGALAVADVSLYRKQVSDYKLQKLRFEEPAFSNCKEYLRLLEERSELEKQKASARAALDEYTQRIMAEYEGTLNKHLDRFLVGFRIQGTRVEHPKGYPSTSYSIVINGIPVGLGNENTSVSEPSFKNTLSGGDRSALALSLFMAELDRAATPPEIAVILDDPFQSQDAFRQTATAHQIKRSGERCGQVIVMSHDERFLKRVWDLLPPTERKTLRLTSVGRATVLSPWDIQEHLKEAHRSNLEALQRFFEEGYGSPRDVAQKLRPAIEGHCRTVCYGEFADGMMMGEIISKIRAEGTGHPLHPLLEELEELNDYARRYHHVSNPGASTEELNESELRAYVNRTLKLTRARLS